MCNSPSGMQFEVTPENKPMPLALWGDSMVPDMNGKPVELLSGAVVRSLASQPPGATEEVNADEFTFQDVVENDPYWQWENEYTVVPKNPILKWVSGKLPIPKTNVLHTKMCCINALWQLLMQMSFQTSSWKSFDAVLIYQKEAIQTSI